MSAARELIIKINGENAGLKRSAAESVDALKKIDKAAKDTGDKAAKGFDLAAFAGKQLKDVVSSVAGQFTALQVGQQVLGAIVTNFENAKKAALDAADQVSDYRKQVLELAALKGNLGNSTPETREQLQFRSRTLQTKQDAIAFQESMLGSGQAAIGSKISQAEFDKLKVNIGSYQSAEGGNAGAYGQLAGMLPSMMNKKGGMVTADEASQKADQLKQIIDLGGFPKYSQGVSQLLKGAGYDTNGVYKSLESRAGVLSAFSLSEPESAGTRLDQFTRLTAGGLGKLRGGPAVDERQAEYWKRLGATNQSFPEDMGKMLADDFKKQEALAAAKNERFNAINYMQKHGFTNEEDIRAGMSYAGMLNGGQLDKFQKAASEMPAANLSQRKVKEFQSVDAAAMQRKTDLAEDLANSTKGAGPMEFYRDLQKQTFALMKAKGEAKGTFEEWDSDWSMIGGKARITSNMQKALVNEAKRVGADVNLGDLQSTDYKAFRSNEGNANAFYNVNQKIAEKGGNAADAIMRELTDINKKQLESLEAQEKRARAAVPDTPAPLPAAPAPTAKRGVNP